MSMPIQTVTVLGAGTMGAAIAGVLADAGLTVHLLDLPAEPDAFPPDVLPGIPPAKIGRNGVAWQGLARMQALRPPNLLRASSPQRIRPGNLEDDLERCIASSDWVVEAIVEDLEAKRSLLARVASVPGIQHCIVSSNTSGLPIGQLCDGLDSAFQRRFLGTHFFNPPRYLTLLELIPHATTDPDPLRTLQTFASIRLGRETVICRDTPYFIGNRIFAFVNQITLNAAIDMGMSVHEVDQLTGQLVGRPKAATFRLCDIVGLDVMRLVCENLHNLIPDDPYREIYRHAGSQRVMQTLQEANLLGNKTGQGFYQVARGPDGAKRFLGLDLDQAQAGNIQYVEPNPVPNALLAEIQGLSLKARFARVLNSDARQGRFLWEVYGRTFEYLAAIGGEIADSVYDIDRAMHWGFHWEMGPFELWDALGFDPTRARMRQSGHQFGPWMPETDATEASEASAPVFHRTTSDARTARRFRGGWISVTPDTSYHEYRDIGLRGTVLAANESATARMDDAGIAFLELHSKLNTLNADTLAVCEKAMDAVRARGQGLVVMARNGFFSAGANLKVLLADLELGDWKRVEAGIRTGQEIFLNFRRLDWPVVAVAKGIAYGGGLELLLAADRVVAHPESFFGLVETGVGLIPAWGGCKEMVRRTLNPAFHRVSPETDLALSVLLTQIGRAQVSRHAFDARNMGYLDADAPVVTRTGQMLRWAVGEIHRLNALGYVSPATTGNVFAAGRDGRANLEMAIHQMHEGGFASAHDRLVASKLAHVLCGGDLDAAAWMDEAYFLDLEREAALSLLGTAETQDRIKYMLTHGKPLRN